MWWATKGQKLDQLGRSGGGRTKTNGQQGGKGRKKKEK